MSLVPADVDQERVLATLGINARDPKAQALLLICQRYDLDPLLSHMQLIQGKPYITRDGYLHVAHRSKVFDGMETLEEGETPTYFFAKVAVWRKDMRRPFTCTARCRKDAKGLADPVDMALVRAERRALKRAFNVAGLPTEDEEYAEVPGLEDLPAIDYATGEITRPTFVNGEGAASAPPGPPALPVHEPALPPLPGEDEVPPAVDMADDWDRTSLGNRVSALPGDLRKKVIDMRLAAELPDAKSPSLTKDHVNAIEAIVLEVETEAKTRCRDIVLACKRVGLESDDERHAIVGYATGNRIKSSKKVTDTELVDLTACLAAVDDGRLVLHMHETDGAYFAPAEPAL